MTVSFRAKLLLSALSSTIIALVVAGVLFAQSMQRRIDARIEETLVAEARLTAELLARSAIPAMRRTRLPIRADTSQAMAAPPINATPSAARVAVSTACS